jgi:hypothetical protein
VIEALDFVKDLKCVLNRDWLARRSPQIRLQGIPEPAVLVLVGPQSIDHELRRSAIETPREPTTIQEPSIAENESAAATHIGAHIAIIALVTPTPERHSATYRHPRHVAVNQYWRNP